jgi:hypothetical protein
LLKCAHVLEPYCQWNLNSCEQINTEICSNLEELACEQQKYCFYNNSADLKDTPSFCLNYTSLSTCSSAVSHHSCQLVTLEKCIWIENSCVAVDECNEFSDELLCDYSGYGCIWNKGFEVVQN